MRKPGAKMLVYAFFINIRGKKTRLKIYPSGRLLSILFLYPSLG
ncbi:MAG: hypothetical protein OP8BY_0673 [Candidatus Saccharicenans subterraneus]|uniref:Uncharacterized protein n=1 Tax=Candidatus Saccharicenans subterraneus TaxID=2508984 RepID=A0A3E2BK60_9BACT|nr:MAG: hypothetical protein OP8BY_0673 [Candidatus Saccharicenans subterraneum]